MRYFDKFEYLSLGPNGGVQVEAQFRGAILGVDKLLCHEPAVADTCIYIYTIYYKGSLLGMAGVHCSGEV